MHKPKYPIYIISKGRWEVRYTQNMLENLGVPYRMVVEDSEVDKYEAHGVPKEKIIGLPTDFRDNPKYAIRDEVTDTLGGSIPVRNFVWEHSIKEGHQRHWILDDNMAPIYRLNKNKKIVVDSGSPFRILEDFVDRYTNVKMAGMNYDFIIPAISKRPPYVLNTRIYSCILLDNSLDIRWRGKYNEDTDLSIRVLKGGDCTMLFNCFLIGKKASMTMKGGNTETVYNVDVTGGKENRSGQNFDNRKEFAESLAKQHPDVARVTWKYDRWHHYVNYYNFSQKPILKSGLNIPKGINERGLVLKEFPRQQQEEVIDG